ncbi:penicillin-binding protein [Kineosporia rhizophila]|uniref:penicillin-binding protein n=1 Tax=Kineosporia TaxID=49184 RepID=UPI001E4B46B2|nr:MULTISPECIES: transglycosylase domain-containing protein [Kineosporia]MCE0538726.1 penicillin-binding protein [Kineosporia rhizophila]GLY19503.1 carboxypeptidase [Kineosporia sp. NBRC 101677]
MSPAPSPRNVLGLLGAFVVTSLVAGVLAAGLAVPAIGASGLAATSAIDAFNELPSELEQSQMAANTRVLAADGSLLATFYDENRELVGIKQVSPFMQTAIVAIEDERFYEHGGVDPKGLIRALVVNEISGGVSQGASTLTQQLVKNMLKQAAYLKGDMEAYDAAQEQTNQRKMREIRLASALEKKMTKKEILEAYLNIAWFGGQINGIQAASKYYFNTTAAKLTLPQAATLAGMVQSPPQFNIAVKKRQKDALERRNTVLDKMYQQGMIDTETHAKAVATKLKADITPTYQGCANSGIRAYYCDYVFNLLTKSPDFAFLGKTEEQRAMAIKRGGYTIKTHLDPKILKTAWKASIDAIPPKDDSRVATATVTVEPGSGKVLSMIQNKYYNPGKGRQNTTINYSTDFNYGGSSGFQTGSTFKPVVLAAWLKEGKSLNASISGAAPYVAANSSFKTCADTPLVGTWTVYNASDGEGGGSMTVMNATAQSVNTAYARMEQQLNLCDVADTAEELGMHQAQTTRDPCITGNLGSDVKNPKTTTKIPGCVPSVVLGVASQSPLTMANAYATFASGGIYCKPVVIASITDRNGKKLAVPQPECKRTMQAKVANTVTLGLSKVFTGGTASSTGPLESGQPASGKTGTTNNSQDSWFVGYTPQLATAVWVGPETVKGKRKEMRRIYINGDYHYNVYGGTIAAPIWKEIMTAALKGKKIKEFPKADAKLTQVPTADVPWVVGMSPDEARDRLEDAGFGVSQGSELETSDQPAGTVARMDPSGRASVGSTITIYISAGPNTGGNDEEDGEDGGDGGDQDEDEDGGQDEGDGGGGNDNARNADDER